MRAEYGGQDQGTSMPGPTMHDVGLYCMDCTSYMLSRSFWYVYRVNILRGNNLLLTWFWHFRQLVGRNCSFLLPKLDCRTSQI